MARSHVRKSFFNVRLVEAPLFTPTPGARAFSSVESPGLFDADAGPA